MSEPSFLRKSVTVATVLCIAGMYACAHRSKNVRHKPYRVMTMERKLSLPDGLTSGEIIGTAKTYLGTKYKFGKSSNESTDCSGFIQLVFRQHGVRLPHSAASQAQFGLLIRNPRDLEPADLVFFETYRRGPSHVGIYLGGNRFIHASTSQKKVMIAEINSEYYVQRFLGGKRLLAI